MTASPELRLLQRLSDGFTDPADTDRYAEWRAKYRPDPVGFAEECFQWKPGEKLAPYQAEMLQDVYTYRREAGRAGRGGGKTSTAAILILHFALTNDIDTDWKIVTTAGSWAQLANYLWPEIRKWAFKLRWDLIGREPFNRQRELLEHMLKLKTGEAFAIATDRPDLIEGAHASRLLFVFDEAKAISDAIFNAAEGSLSSGECFAFCISTPGETLGRFYDIHTGKYPAWHTRHITLTEALASGQVLQSWVNDRKKEWMPSARPDLWHNQVEGQFYTTSPDSLVPAHWLDEAYKRYEAKQQNGSLVLNREVNVSFGVDVAEFGGDRFAITRLNNMDFAEQQVYQKLEIMAGTGYVVGMVGTRKDAPIAIDANGVGAGVWSRLRELKYTNALRVMVSAKTNATDRFRVNKFTNVRALLYWMLREALDPTNDPEQLLALPFLPDLAKEITTPKWERRSNGMIEIESKASMKERLGSSPDLMESLMLAIWANKARHRGWNVV